MSSDLTLDDIIDRERDCGVLHGPAWQHKYLSRAPEKVRKELELARRFPGIRAVRESLETPIQNDINPTSFTAVTSISETNLWSPSLWTPIPANDSAAGNSYVVMFGGIYSNRATGTPTSTWTPRWGTSGTPGSNTTLGASIALYSGSALTNAPMFGQFEFTIRTLGSSGTGIGTGYVWRGGASATGIRQMMGGTAATIDTTIAGGLVISHTWSAANASNTLTPTWACLRARS